MNCRPDYSNGLTSQDRKSARAGLDFEIEAVDDYLRSVASCETGLIVVSQIFPSSSPPLPPQV